jgi:hypothetical protein
MRILPRTLGSRWRPGMGFAFMGKEENNMFVKEPKAGEDIRTSNGEVSI